MKIQHLAVYFAIPPNEGEAVKSNFEERTIIMATVTVYNFEVPDIREGDYVFAKGKCTEETIKSFHGRLIEGTVEIIDETLLNETARYYPANEHSP